MSRPRNLRKPTPRRCAAYWDDYIAAWRAVGMAVINDIPEYDGPFLVVMGLRTVDAHWTRFIRAWRNMTRKLFLPRCSRSEPCCENECENLAEHFARTGDIP